MKQPRKTMAIIGLFVILGAAGVGIRTTLAEETSNQPRNIDSLVTAIAEKFNLNVSDVQAVFDEHRDAMMAEREAREQEMLVQAVTDGKLTQGQADLITAKRQEIKEAMASRTGEPTQADRQAMKTRMDELKAWAESNDIPMFYLHFGDGRRGRPGDGFGPPPGPKPDDDQSEESETSMETSN